MKDILQDQYLFEQKPPTTEPGFVVFQDADEEEFYWFFHCTDMDGMPLLFSQPYLTIESARKGMQSAINNLQKKNIKMIAVEDLFHLSVFAGNYQEVARTKGFSTQEACEEHIDYLTNVGASKRPEVILTTSRRNVELETNERSLTKHNMETEMLTSSSRHTFQIKYYERNGDDIYGTIAHLASGDHRLLKGLDMVEIADFIREKSGYFRELKNDLELPLETSELAESNIDISSPLQPIATPTVRKIVLGGTNANTTDFSKEVIIEQPIQHVEKVENIGAVMIGPTITDKAPAKTPNIVSPTPRINLHPILMQQPATDMDEFTQTMIANAMNKNNEPLQNAVTQVIAKQPLVEQSSDVKPKPLDMSKYFSWMKNEATAETKVNEPVKQTIVMQKPTIHQTLQRQVVIYQKKAEPSSLSEKRVQPITFVPKSVRH